MPNLTLPCFLTTMTTKTIFLRQEYPVTDAEEREEFIILIFYINSNEKAKAEENKNAHLIHIALKPTVDPLKK